MLTWCLPCCSDAAIIPSGTVPLLSAKGNKLREPKNMGKKRCLRSVTVGWCLEARSSSFSIRKIEHGRVDGAPLLSVNPQTSRVTHCILISLCPLLLFSNCQGPSLFAVLPSSFEWNRLLTEGRNELLPKHRFIFFLPRVIHKSCTSLSKGENCFQAFGALLTYDGQREQGSIGKSFSKKSVPPIIWCLQVQRSMLLLS